MKRNTLRSLYLLKFNFGEIPKAVLYSTVVEHSVHYPFTIISSTQQTQTANYK